MNPAACSLYEYSPLVVMPRVAFFVNEPGAGSSFGKIVVSNISTAAVSCGRTYNSFGWNIIFVCFSIVEKESDIVSYQI